MPTILITGASRGIGRVSAQRLADSGWTVLAGVRTDADGDRVRDGGRIIPVRLDVTDPDDLAALPDRVRDAAGGLDVLVNNAGVVVGGPIEGVPLAELRRQFEVNVVAQVAVTQAVLPMLRASRGRIVFVSSISGLVSSPMLGPYSASKFALEAVADALRMELTPWRVRVSLIEPGNTDTDIWRLAGDTLDDTESGLAPEHRALYAKHIKGMRRAVPMMQRTASSPDKVAAVIEHAASARRPRARYLVGSGSRVQGVGLKNLPRPLRDAALRLGTGIPRKA